MLLLITNSGISDTNERGGDFPKPPVNSEQREMPFPPVLKHPGLHPPRPAGDSIAMAPIQTDPAHSLQRLAHQPVNTSFLAPQPLLMETAKSPTLTLPLLTSDALGASLPAL